MSKIMVTGATGQLGQKVLEHLNLFGISSSEIAVLVRTKDQEVHMRQLGFDARLGSYEDASSLENAFTGVEKLLFISSPDLDNTLRIKQHAQVVFAARNAGVKHLVYTSIAFAEEMNVFGLQYVHLATEAMIKTTDIPFTFLRNAFYLENIADDLLKNALSTGILTSSTQEGRFNFVLREELAKAAAKVLVSEGHENKVYELVNETNYSYDELAQALSQISNTPVVHENRTPQETIEAYLKAGAPEGLAAFNVYGIHLPIAQGQFRYTQTDLSKLIEETPLPLEEALRRLLV